MHLIVYFVFSYAQQLSHNESDNYSLDFSSHSGSSVIPSSEEMDWYKAISLQLYEVLDNVGMSKEVRMIEAELVSTLEILLTLLKRPSVHIFGSQSECSKIPGTESDTDIVYIPPDMRLVTNIADYHDSDGFLLVPDRQPGYARLQVIVKGQPVTKHNVALMLKMQIIPNFYQFQYDKVNRVCLTRDWSQANNVNTHRQGPALNYHGIYGIYPSQDFVFALNCDTLLECASEWLTRERQHGWPSDEVIDKCKSMGFLVVHVAHPDSDEPDLQWRISFSHQELTLVRCFNLVQLKCYILLKCIKKDFIQLHIKEETLSSYHCKTCMFYCIENTPAEFWAPENLAGCLLMCLRQLMVWVTIDNCPNYFIPGENMFDRIRSDKLKKQLLVVLHTILIFCYDMLLNNLHQRMITAADQVREMCKSKQFLDYDLKEVSTCKIIDSDEACLNQYVNDLFATMRMTELLMSFMQLRIFIIARCLDSHKHCIDVDKLHAEISRLEQTTVVTTHTEKQSKEAISLILPHLQLSLLSLRVVEVYGKGNDRLQEILNTSKWAELDITTGISKLKQACGMFMLGYAAKSMEILMDVVQDRKHMQLPICHCYENLTGPDIPFIITGVPCEELNRMVKKLLATFYQPCVIFLPNEYHISPVAINYEMIRAYGRAPLHAHNRSFKYWYKWGVVEGSFLTHFLISMNAKALRQSSLATEALKNMILVCNEKFPNHLDTSYNLLGWVFKDRGDIARAVECFQKSLRVEPVFNAAYWHLCFLICGY